MRNALRQEVHLLVQLEEHDAGVRAEIPQGVVQVEKKMPVTLQWAMLPAVWKMTLQNALMAIAWITTEEISAGRVRLSCLK